MTRRGGQHFLAALATQEDITPTPPYPLHTHHHTLQFGSGWAWLVTDKSGKLSVTKTPNAVVPVVEGKTPVLTMDVWGECVCWVWGE